MYKCTSEANDFIKSQIYRNKVNVFGSELCEFTKKTNLYFLEKYKFNPQMIIIDKMDYDTLHFKNENLIVCLKERTKSNITPMIYINGMYIGNFKSLEEKTFLKDLDIFF